MTDTDRDQLYFLLYQAFIEIREEAAEKRHSKAFKLTDLLHTLPLKLNKRTTDDHYSEILDRLSDRASSKQLSSWLDNALAQAPRN